MSFVHLHTHTEYSLLDGSNRIKEYVKCVKDLGMTAAAITDHGSMFGVIDFYEEAIRQGIKPIIGCEVYVAPGSRFDKSGSTGEKNYFHLVLLAKNNEGYQNLIKIVSKGYTEGFYYKPRIDYELLEQYHENLIALSACLAGEVPTLIRAGRVDEAREVALKYKALFGEDNYYLELQDHGIAAQTTVNMELMKISRELDIPLVATNDIHYTYKSDYEAHDVLLCIQTGAKLSDEGRMTYEPEQFYVKSEEEMRALFPYALQAIDNTARIAEMCDVSFSFGETKLPRFDVPEGYDAWSYLNKLCLDGLKYRYPDTYEDNKPRLDYELGIIKNMGFVEYFLIVWDFINYAKSRNIMVGPGRGSAAGSLVAYCLRITELDPIKYNLLFERFLNPERVTMPDIDVDFADVRRQEVIDYVSEKYGAEKVVQIVTFGTLKARAVIKDVGRAMDINFDLVNQITKMIPQELGMTIGKALEINVELREKYENDEDIHRLIDMSLQLEGLPRHASTHASGVIICRDAADDLVPLCTINGGPPMAQFPKDTCEHIGLLKMDFLGLTMQTVIQDAVMNIKKTQGIDIDIDHIDFDDKKVYASIATGKTDGIFQLESAGMKSFMKELRPQNLEEVIAGISLYRPGPMDFIPRYIAGKLDTKSIAYACPELEHILAPTYGCIVYQEQVMQIVRDLAGYTMGRSDKVRSAMAKKKMAVMEYERNIFVNGNAAEIEEDRAKGLEDSKIRAVVNGCVNNGIDEKTANGIYDTMIDFAKYAFNKSHAACYAVVAYQTAYLKYYYPMEYMAALMTSDMGNTTKISAYIVTCKNMGIPILPPDINEGFVGFTPTKDGIRYALTAIKGVGFNVIEGVVSEREAGGAYRDIEDFVSRNSQNGVNRRAVENFIKAGAFDGLGGNRHQYMMIYNDVFDSVHMEQKNSMSGQMSLLDLLDESDKQDFKVTLPEVAEYEKEVLLGFEKEVLGIYISGHPLDRYVNLWDKRISTKTIDFYLDEETDDSGEAIADGAMNVADGDKVTLAGMITSKKIKYTKRNDAMAFVDLEDLFGSVEVIIFPKVYSKYQSRVYEDARVVMSGHVSVEPGKDGKLICDDLYDISEITGNLWLQFASEEEYGRLYPGLEKIMDSSDGRDNVKIYISDIKKVIPLPANKSVMIEPALIKELTDILGEENIKVTY